MFQRGLAVRTWTSRREDTREDVLAGLPRANEELHVVPIPQPDLALRTGRSGARDHRARASGQNATWMWSLWSPTIQPTRRPSFQLYPIGS
jgi:hypothetical protein